MTTAKTLAQIRGLYNDPKYGLVGKNQFIRNLIEADINFNIDTINELFRKDASISLNKPVIKNFERRSIYVSGIDDIWATDLAFLPQFKKENDGISVMLFVIDMFSKYLWVIPLPNKTAEAVTEGFKKLFKSTKRRPKKINSDKGGEFKAQTLKFWKENDIEHYFTYNDTKSPIVERVQRTIKNRIGRLLDGSGDYRYIDVLPEIVKSYNNTTHSTIKMTPTEASDPKNEEEVLYNLSRFHERKHSNKLDRPKFKIGDYVRISVKKGLFEKEITHKWSREVFKIKKMLPTTPYTYTIEDLKQEELQGSFYEPELQKVEIDEDVQEIEIIDRRVVRGQKQVRIRFKDGKERWEVEDNLSTI